MFRGVFTLVVFSDQQLSPQLLAMDTADRRGSWEMWSLLQGCFVPIKHTPCTASQGAKSVVVAVVIVIVVIDRSSIK